jgi:hypothetical protein
MSLPSTYSFLSRPFPDCHPRPKPRPLSNPRGPTRWGDTRQDPHAAPTCSQNLDQKIPWKRCKYQRWECSTCIKRYHRWGTSTRLEVESDGRGRPPPKGARRVALVELEPVVPVPPREQECHAEWPQPCHPSAQTHEFQSHRRRGNQAPRLAGLESRDRGERGGDGEVSCITEGLELYQQIQLTTFSAFDEREERS